MSTAIMKRLRAAADNRRLVRLSRSFDDIDVRGYVLDIGSEFFSLAVVSDRLRYDGFECFRIADVEDVEDDPHAKFAEAALARRSQERPHPPALDLSSAAGILSSVRETVPLVTLHSEVDDPDICHIGRVMAVEGTIVWLLEIDPDAVWDAEPSAHRLREVTRVNFGGDYEDALALIGGEPPKAVTRAAVPLRLVPKDE